MAAVFEMKKVHADDADDADVDDAVMKRLNAMKERVALEKKKRKQKKFDEAHPVIAVVREKIKCSAQSKKESKPKQEEKIIKEKPVPEPELAPPSPKKPAPAPAPAPAEKDLGDTFFEGVKVKAPKPTENSVIRAGTNGKWLF
jgi:type IV secretory pathway VirB10-like protein